MENEQIWHWTSATYLASSNAWYVQHWRGNRVESAIMLNGGHEFEHYMQHVYSSMVKMPYMVFGDFTHEPKENEFFMATPEAVDYQLQLIEVKNEV